MYPSTLGSHNMRCTTRLPDAIKCFSEYLRQAGYYCTNNAKTDYNFAVPKTAWDETATEAHWRKRQPGQPFFSVFNFTVCHESQIRQSDASFAKNTARLTPDQRHDPAGVSIPPFHPDTPEVRRDWARYHDLITAMDYQAGDVLRKLDEDGLADDTIVFFFGDNGAGMPGCKKWVWETGLHVPLIARFPAKYRSWSPGEAGSTCDRLVSFVDFAPTVLSLAGVAIPPHMQGHAFLGPKAGEPRKYIYAIRDRMAERFDTVRVVRDKQFQYVRNFQPHRSWSQFTSYTEEMPTMKVWRAMAEAGQLNAIQARYFQPTKPVEELYDTAADPHQVQQLGRRSSVQRRCWSECGVSVATGCCERTTWACCPSTNWSGAAKAARRGTQPTTRRRIPWSGSCPPPTPPTAWIPPTYPRYSNCCVPTIRPSASGPRPAWRPCGEKARPATDQLLTAAKDDSPGSPSPGRRGAGQRRASEPTRCPC